MDVRVRLYQYLKAQGLATSTILEYMKMYDNMLRRHPDFIEWGNEKSIAFLSEIPDPITRSNKRNLILKVHRDVLNKPMNIPFIKKPTRIKDIYSHDEVKRIFSHIHNAKHLAIAYLLYVEGFRVGEVVSILKSDCNKGDKSIIIRSTKNRNDYKKYLDDSTINVLSDYCTWLKERRIALKKYLFEGTSFNQYSTRSIQEIMRTAIEKSGMPIKGSCHIFRRSSSVWKLENNWSVQHIAASLNNTPRTVSKYYAYVRPEYLKTLSKPQL